MRTANYPIVVIDIPAPDELDALWCNVSLEVLARHIAERISQDLPLQEFGDIIEMPAPREEVSLDARE